MRVGILGPLEVVAEGKCVHVGGSRLRALLIRLSLDAGRLVSGTALADAVWPGDGPADRINALQSLAARLRRVLPAGLLSSAEGGYRLDVPADAVDACRFERMAAEGHRALNGGEPETALRLLREGLGLWRGDVPDELPITDRKRLNELRLTATEDRVEAMLAMGEIDGLTAELQEFTAAYPFRERPRGQLIRTLRAEGRQAEALAAYEEFRSFLADELGADPGPELQQVHLAALRGETPRRPPQVHISAPPTSFVGRTEEIAHIRGLLAAGRLVTLVGPGGVGKTRLATAVAADAPFESWLVELASLNDPDYVAHVAIDALGARETGMLEASRDPMHRLAETLRGRDALIVLDNCEHLIDAVARFAGALLGRCPGLRIIATTREPLRIPGEAICPVPPLPPDAALRLFADRATAVRPGFTVTDGDQPLVEEICRRLDGLPLALELAAARLRSLPLKDLAARLDTRLALLARGDRSPEPRHRTLRAVIAWSWDLLDERERRLARRLAAFPGDITVESAESVTGAGFDLLAALADRSLLQFDGERYRMLETIREYALEELTKSGELGRVRAAHAAYFTGLAERAEPFLRASGQLPWIARLSAERDNLLAALHHACETGDAAAGVRLCAALGMFWIIRGDHQAMACWMRLALAVPGATPPDARAIVVTLHMLATGPWIGRELREGAVEEVRGLIPELDAAHPLVTLIEPLVTFATGDVAAAMTLVECRLSHPEIWTRAMLRLTRAVMYGKAGEMARMRGDLEVAIAGFRAVGERAGLAWSLTSLADLRTTQGEYEGAIACLEEAVRLLRELDPADGAVLQRVWIAEARSRTGDTVRARAELLELMRADGGALAEGYEVFARITLGDIARRDGDVAEATRQLRLAGDHLGCAYHLEPLYRVMLDCVAANLAMDNGDHEGALRHLREAFELSASSSDLTLAAITAAHLARSRALQGRAAAAVELLGAVHTLLGAFDALDSELVSLVPRLRKELGEHAYEIAYSRGKNLDHDGALAMIEARLS